MHQTYDHLRQQVLSGLYLLLLLCPCAATAAGAPQYALRSPDGGLVLRIRVDHQISYTLSFRGRELLRPSTLFMALDGKDTLGVAPRVRDTATRSVDRVLHPLYGPTARLEDRFRELKIVFEGHYALVFRAYDQGVAYRFLTDFDDSLRVTEEGASFRLAGHPASILAEAHNLTSWELPYTRYEPGAPPAGDTAILPALFSPRDSRVRLVLAEADTRDYPGMYIRVQGDQADGCWAGYPARTSRGSWGNFVSVVRERAPYIAHTAGRRAFPWRVVMVSGDDRDLMACRLVYQLAEPSRLTHTGWIRPGKAAWEWWSDAMLPGAPIPSGMDNRNTALYKYYVDFAAAQGLEYVLVDAGWSDIFHLPRTNPHIDIRQLIAYAARRHVGVFLWCVAPTLMDSLQGNMHYLKSLGAAGVKVDFFDRNDQLATRWYEQIAEAAAGEELMIDFHGCGVPTGLQRTYPNVLNFEAVRGNECNKWDSSSGPDYHLLLPFLRQLAGPMDYTPGSMRNASRETFRPQPKGMPFSQGTRCHELALYLLLDQPLAMLCGSPALYARDSAVMDFLSAVPTSFDDTRVLLARLGEYAAVARRKGDDWFVGAMTSWTPRRLELDFSFLPPGVSYTAELYADAGGEDASRYRHRTLRVDRTTRLPLVLASGGGAVLRLHR